MPLIKFQGHAYKSQPDETVLECLTRHDVSIPVSCRSGICQCCMMKAVTGHPPTDAQKGLKEALRLQNYFLACICKPDNDLELALPGTDITHHITTTVVDKKHLSKDVIRLRLECSGPFSYRPGQFLNLFRSDGLVRSYSIASLPQHNEALELHVRKIDGGAMSTWIHDKLSIGDTLDVEGPVGDCFYIPGDTEKPLLLVGTGCGLAPLWGILRDALDRGHSGPIDLFHGSYLPEGLYLVDELKELDARHSNFRYTPCTDTSDTLPGFSVGRASQIALERLPNLIGRSVFICGHIEMVEDMKKKVFLAGAALSDIHTDPVLCLPGAKKKVANQ